MAKAKKSSLAALFPEGFSSQLIVSGWRVVGFFSVFMNECNPFAQRGGVSLDALLLRF